MAIHITRDTMILEIGDRVVATARFSQHAGPAVHPRLDDYRADRRGAGESGHPGDGSRRRISSASRLFG